MRSNILITLFTLAFVSETNAQTTPFKIALEPVSIAGLGGVQSYAYGQADGKWLIIGGRKDGLHRRQPFASFNATGKNSQLLVIDPFSLKKWELPLTSLSIDLQEQLSSTNMQFHQEGKYLYITGGYGYSSSLGDHITYGKLTAVDVPYTINAIVNNQPIQPFFRQISDTIFAVTGGHLKKIHDTYYLVGGQKFLGRYNPMGSDHGPGFIQQYSDQIRKFNIIDDGTNISISNYHAVTDASAFHRRDYNVVPQILTDGAEGLSIFSGAFQPNANIPFLNSTTIDSKSYVVDNSFAQYYNHYHSAVLPLYSQLTNEMHNIFFGGIAQYYDEAGVLVQNDEVPFVKTIARVTRDSKGNLAEYKLPVEMPALLGAVSEFILLPDIPQYANEVIKLDKLNSDTTLVGHIYGGIASTLPNVFFVNTGKESTASNTLFKVYIIRNAAATTDKLNPQSTNGLQMQVYPDTNEGLFTINFSLKKTANVELQIKDADGKILKKEILKGLKTGQNSITKKVQAIKPGKAYWVTVKTPYAQSTQKIIIEP